MSRSAENGDDTLVKLLNERAASDRHVLIARDQLEELKQYKVLLAEVTARAKYNEKQLAKLQVENTHLDKEKTQLGFDLEKVKTRVREEGFSWSPQESTGTLKGLVLKVSKLLNSHGKQLMDLNISPMSKSTLNKNIKTIQDLLEKTVKLTGNNDNFELEEENRTLKKEVKKLRGKDGSIVEYRQLLEKMREQTHSLREKLNHLEKGGNSKQIIEEQEITIRALKEEKQIMQNHVKSMQHSMNEQCGVIEHLKKVISSLSAERRLDSPPQLSSLGTPQSTQLRYSFEDPPENYEEKQLQQEIASLDHEIQQLQNSLQNALANR